MAIIQSVLMSKASGSIGNISLATIKGRVIAKEKATIVANPRTPKQVSQRNALSRTVYAWQMVSGVVKVGNTTYGKYSNPYAGFISNNVEYFKGIAKDAKELVGSDLISVQATKGKYAPLTRSFVSVEPNKLTLKVNFSSVGDDLKENDSVYLVFTNKTHNRMYSFKATVGVVDPLLMEKNIVFAGSKDFTSSEYVSAVFYVSSDGKNSTSSYFQ
ncbi:DUF6266 family protein [Tenacibaculum piscium]|uniref:DUF6266 family protein n=1 Tax=Tenacibaculum piscium TaxID=1458515 RepID=UPI001F214A4C|nr:DUF6266 family protein [Tenacibaculum piscium]